MAWRTERSQSAVSQRFQHGKQLHARLQKINLRFQAVLLLVLALDRPGVGILTRDEGIMTCQDRLQPRQVDLALDIAQVAEHLGRRPLPRSRLVEKLIR